MYGIWDTYKILQGAFALCWYDDIWFTYKWELFVVQGTWLKKHTSTQLDRVVQLIGRVAGKDGTAGQFNPLKTKRICFI
jgi:hypothetical protein